MIMNRHSPTKNIRGVTLIELMLAVAISAILLLGVGTLYGNSKRTYTVDEEFARLQENARFAMKYLVEDIRMAGYLGCVLNDNNPTRFGCYLGGSYICDNASIGLLNAGLEGFDADTAGLTATTPPVLDTGIGTDWGSNGGAVAALPAQFPVGTTPPVAGSDIIIVRHGSQRGGRLSALDPAGANLTVADPTAAGLTGTCHTPSDICTNDVLVVSDCQRARVFQATGLAVAGGGIQITHTNAGTPGNAIPTWTGANAVPFTTTDTEVMKLRTFAYFVANNPENQPALFRHNGIAGAGSLTEELVEGIENMQILYGVDTDATPDGVANRYAPASAVNFTDLTRPIVSVRISLLVRSREIIPNRPPAIGPHTLAGTVINNVSDQRLRKIFTTTIKVRNKGL